MPLSLTDHQLALVMAAAGPLDPDKRIVLMERVGASCGCKESAGRMIATSRWR